MKSAIINTGGKQYLVTKGDKVKVEKLPAKTNEVVDFDKVLLVTDDKKTEVGQPYVEKALVKAKVLGHGKSKKVTAVKMKPKKRNRQYFGHRQQYTEVEIEKIEV